MVKIFKLKGYNFYGTFAEVSLIGIYKVLQRKVCEFNYNKPINFPYFSGAD